MRAYYLLAAACFLLLSCDKTETELYTSELVSQYAPVQVGKYITYRTDSTVFTNFGRAVEIHSYQEKHVVDAQVTDALGRDAYRVFRYIRAVNAAPADHWQPTGSYVITPTPTSLEVNENNLRMLKLALPLKENASWKGFQYFPEDAFKSSYGLPNDFYADWENTIVSMNASTTINGTSFANVMSIQAANDSLNSSSGTTVIDKLAFADRNYFVEKYAKGVGLIFQEVMIWEYQPSLGGYQNGFGVKRSIIDHN